MPNAPQGWERPTNVVGNAITAADAARRIAERSGPLILEHGSTSRISLIEGDNGRFVLAVDARRRLGYGSIYLRRLDGSPFEHGHVLALPQPIAIRSYSTARRGLGKIQENPNCFSGTIPDCPALCGMPDGIFDGTWQAIWNRIPSNGADCSQREKRKTQGQALQACR
jgi:hypothetical protein